MMPWTVWTDLSLWSLVQFAYTGRKVLFKEAAKVNFLMNWTIPIVLPLFSQVGVTYPYNKYLLKTCYYFRTHSFGSPDIVHTVGLNKCLQNECEVHLYLFVWDFNVALWTFPSLFFHLSGPSLPRTGCKQRFWWRGALGNQDGGKT